MRLFSPIVIGVAGLIAVLAVAVLFLEPGLWARAVLALVFLPVGGMMMTWVARRQDDPVARRRRIVRTRAAMVGAGALLISALGFAVAENLNLVSSGGGRTVVSLLLVIVVVFGDLLAARMEAGANDKPD